MKLFWTELKKSKHVRHINLLAETLENVLAFCKQNYSEYRVTQIVESTAEFQSVDYDITKLGCNEPENQTFVPLGAANNVTQSPDSTTLKVNDNVEVVKAGCGAPTGTRGTLIETGRNSVLDARIATPDGSTFYVQSKGLKKIEESK